MGLWKVTFAGLGSRYVPAGTGRQAMKLLEADLIAALALSVEPAEPEVGRRWQKLRSERSRQQFLVEFDELSAAMWKADRRRAEIRRLERELASLRELDEWIRRQLAKAPPIALNQVPALARLVGVDPLSLDEKLDSGFFFPSRGHAPSGVRGP